MRYTDLTGNTYGLLTVLRYAGNTKKGQATWHCLCACGGEKTTAADNLKRGSTKSCGCIAQAQREVAARSRCHALSKANKPRERGAWAGMLRRCYDLKHGSYRNYGEQGIVVCDRWRESFANFYADMGDAPVKHTLERIDSKKDYAPNNCRWATMKEQANNRRNNRLLTFNGETLNMQQWSDRLGWHKSVIATRLHYGWTLERALTQEPRVVHR